MAEDHLISHSNESKVLTLEDTSIDQQEFDDTFPSFLLTRFVCGESVLPEPQRAKCVIINDSLTDDESETDKNACDSDIHQCILSDGHYNAMVDKDRAPVQTVAAALSHNNDSQTTINDNDVCRDRDIIRSMLQDGKYDMSVEEYAALQMAISQDGFHTPSSTNDDDMDAHDCEILQSILNDGNYEMSADDAATLETVIATLTSPAPVTDLCRFSSEENTSCDESQILSVTNENDSAILQSILDDGNYEIGDEDRAALHSVIKILITGSSVFDVTNEPTLITDTNNVTDLAMVDVD
jgi:hypothetical protein